MKNIVSGGRFACSCSLILFAHIRGLQRKQLTKNARMAKDYNTSSFCIPNRSCTQISTLQFDRINSARYTEEFHHYGIHTNTYILRQVHVLTPIVFCSFYPFIAHFVLTICYCWICDVCFELLAVFFFASFLSLSKTNVVQMNLFMIPHENKHDANSTHNFFFLR